MNCLGGTTVAGTVEAGVLIGIEALTSGLIVVTVESMMTGTIIMRVIAGNTGAEAFDIGEEEVEVLEEGGIAVQPVMAVKRDVLELSDGTGRGKSKCIQIKLTHRKTMATCKMVMSISSKSNKLGREDMDTDLCGTGALFCHMECVSFSPSLFLIFGVYCFILQTQCLIACNSLLCIMIGFSKNFIIPTTVFFMKAGSVALLYNFFMKAGSVALLYNFFLVYIIIIIMSCIKVVSPLLFIIARRKFCRK